MRVIRRRDGALLDAELTTNHPASRRQAAVLLIGGEAYDPAELVGYVLAEASPAELAELRRAGYDLRQVA